MFTFWHRALITRSLCVVDMTIYRQRSSSHSSQQSWGSTSGDSGTASDQSAPPPLPPPPSVGNHITPNMLKSGNGLDQDGNTVIMNGYLTPQQHGHHHHHHHKKSHKHHPTLTGFSQGGQYSGTSSASGEDSGSETLPSPVVMTSQSRSGYSPRGHVPRGQSPLPRGQGHSPRGQGHSPRGHSPSPRRDMPPAPPRHDHIYENMNGYQYPHPAVQQLKEGLKNSHRPRAKTLNSLDMQRDRALRPRNLENQYPDNPYSTMNGKDLGNSYDASVAKILELHKTLAQSYTCPPNPNESYLKSMSEPKAKRNNLTHAYSLEQSGPGPLPQKEVQDQPPALPVRARAKSVDMGVRPPWMGMNGSTIGGMVGVNGQYFPQQYPPYYGTAPPPMSRRRKDSDHDSAHSTSNSNTGTPNSSAPSTPTNEQTPSIPNGYATLRGKPAKFNLHTISENLGQLFSKSNKTRNGSSTDEEPLSPVEVNNNNMRKRSNSIGNFLGVSSLTGTSEDDLEDSDDNHDDYGFLSPLYSSLHTSLNVSSTAMHKAKSPTQAHRILPKKWRKSKLLTPSGSKSTALWKPQVRFLIIFDSWKE